MFLAWIVGEPVAELMLGLVPVVVDEKERDIREDVSLTSTKMSVISVWEIRTLS